MAVSLYSIYFHLFSLLSRGFVSVVDEQPIKIRLTDVNDEIPRFVNVPKPFLSTVPTNAAPGSSVYHLMAQDDDQDSDILYNLESGQFYLRSRSRANPPVLSCNSHQLNLIY